MQMMTSLLNPIHHLLFFITIFIFFTKSSYSSSQAINSSSVNFCPEIERRSLLTFKQSLQDSSNRLSSWGNGEAINCCKWEGVVCNNSTGHVHRLRLQTHHLGGKINPSLLNLKHLTYLDLSGNNFAETIPSYIGSLSSLEYLNLSGSGLSGRIPPHIGNLSNLRTLDFDMNYLESDNLEWLSGLSKLEYLNLNSGNLSRENNWAEAINSLPRLLRLHLSDCSIDPSQDHVNNRSTSLTLIDLSQGIYDSDFSFLPIPQWFFQLKTLVHLDLHGRLYSGQIPTFSNATNLRFLDLSWNYLKSSNVPDWVYSCKDLEFLDLSTNSIEGQIPEAIRNLTSLESLHLGSNQLSGKLPTQITSLCRLQSLDLSYNRLQGQAEDLFGKCFLGSLHDLDLSHNRLSGHLTEQLGEFKLLESLSLTNNLLSGTIPISIGKLSSLVYLRLDQNKFTGNLPVGLGKLSKMYEFHVDNNQLEGIVTEAHFAPNLETFSASGNHLNLSVGPDWTAPFQIMDLRLGTWSLGAGSSKIPSWLQTRRNIDALDVSNSGISGTPPTWFFNISFLNISNNNLHGNIPYSNNGNADMSRNNFNGSLPRIGDNMWGLDLSHNTFSEGLSDFLCDSTNRTYQLVSLLLEGNRLSGELPDCWEKWQSLFILNLANNSMSGILPNSLGFLQDLMSLNLYGNNFSGQIPLSMSNLSSLLKMDLGRNSLDGTIPTWIGTSLTDLKFLILRLNNFSGGIPSELCHLQSLQILDLSGNSISGIIPKCLHNLTAMATKRLLNDKSLQVSSIYGFKESASVATKGGEFEYSTILSLVTNIDLSSNHLRGGIPKELTSLVELGSLNLSRNQLSGSIPKSIGEMKQLESLDLSSNFLTGQIPNNFTLLSSLSFLDLSFNNLSGRIPQSTQLQTMEASSFIGNDLCGPPLTKNCSGSDGEEVHGHEDEGEERKGEIEWMYVFLSAGYAVGFSGVCSVLVLKKRWREAYFGMLERIWDKLYVYFHVWIKKF